MVTAMLVQVQAKGSMTGQFVPVAKAKVISPVMKMLMTSMNQIPKTLSLGMVQINYLAAVPCFLS